MRAIETNSLLRTQRRLSEFKAHAIIDTEHNVPIQITFCALTGGVARWRMIVLDQRQSPLTYPRQALRQLPHRIRVGASGIWYLPFFGKVNGITVNYALDHAVRFDLRGEPVERLPQAYLLGQVTVK